jgi:hypothetical protein
MAKKPQKPHAIHADPEKLAAEFQGIIDERFRGTRDEKERLKFRVIHKLTARVGRQRRRTQDA